VLEALLMVVLPKQRVAWVIDKRVLEVAQKNLALGK
jgi:hypothetical protein